MISQEFEKTYPFIGRLYFKNLLKNVHPEAGTISVTDYTLNAALPVGENFGSQMVRAVVNYSLDGGAMQTKSLILKLTTNDMLKPTFESEGNIYSDVLPNVESLLRSIGDDTQIAAICYQTYNDPHQLVFEDLKELGYENVDKTMGCNIHHIRPMFTKLAKYHAATAKLLFDKKIDQTKVNSPFVLTLCLDSHMQLLAEEIATWDGFQQIASKFRLLQVDYMKKIAKSYEYDETDLIVLNHGDPWSNNIMFKHSKDGDVEDTLLVDFQGGFTGSPVHDLSYSMFSNFPSLTEEERDLAFQHYHRILVETLTSLDYPKERVPSLRAFRDEFYRKICMEIALFLDLYSYVGQFDKLDIDDFFIANENAVAKRRKRFQQPEFIQIAKPYILFLDRKGVLD